jgi:hypothetical protein
MDTQDAAQEPKHAVMSPRSMAFWRHIVGIAIVLLAQHPRLYGNGIVFFGLWSGTVAIALVGAGVVTGLLHLFFTARTKGKAWRIFVAIAWVFALLQLFGEWALPSIVRSIPSVSRTNQREANPPDWDTLLTREEYDRRKARADAICRKGNLIDFDCQDEVFRGKR